MGLKYEKVKRMKQSDLKRLFKSNKVVKLGENGEFELTLHKLGLDDMEIVAEFESVMERQKAKSIQDPDDTSIDPEVVPLIRKLTRAILRKSLEDATDENNLDVPWGDAVKIFNGYIEMQSEDIDMPESTRLELIKRLQKTNATATTGN